ncbi:MULTISPECIES: hypothetical protein [Rhizobium]|uniref:hypothetical protein n=1 Tax=Rhizobium TaxID=379 RepID=UPI0013F1767F|nr:MULTISPECIES: hypothetical protein [Rhizobium]MBY3222983.1 hypothetical protein [Rhizobium laguerreae]MBY3238199.1 hypothetical protein [Rhizobium laguerreae]MBY3379109.1 hypothetical protein [Rhizobium laguerreae]MBY5864691.1 hypothetical protein [Rhizobium leguminosarum]MDU0307052.1 hypothetical protein [Rhizobium sp. 10PS4]
MQGKASDLAPKSAEIDAGSDHLRAHRCFACLSSKRPENAIARLVADGFDPERIANHYPSLKTEH